MVFRELKAEEIEVRVQQCNEKGCSLLLYKDARCDMRILDETVGPEKWQREHYDCKGTLFCRVGIKCGDEWIWKADCGVESNTEAQKGESSDSFKRACFNWGIGRSLYTAPFIWLKPDQYQAKQVDVREKTVYQCKDKFFVEKIKIVDGVIVGLSIKNERTGARVFVLVPSKEEGDEGNGKNS